jgi:hypothetical protein
MLRLVSFLRPRVLRFAAPLALLALLAPSAAAEEAAGARVVRLRTGESVKCRPIKARSDDRSVMVEDLLRGTLRVFAWEALETADRDALWVEWQWVGTGTNTVKGVRLVTRVSGGDDTEIYGVIEREEGGTVYLRRSGEILPVPVGQIVDRSEENLDPRDVWNSAQLMERLAAELAEAETTVDATDGRTAWRVAQYAEWAGALPEALAAYRRAAADPEFLQRAVAEARAANVEALIRDEAAFKTLRDLKTKLSSDMFAQVRAGVEGFAAKHPGASEAVVKAFEAFQATWKTRRDKTFRKMARYDFVKVCDKLVDAKVREKDVTLADAKTWVRRELAEKAFEELGVRMGRRDTVTPEEVRGWWDTRWEGSIRSGWTRRSYGQGTQFIYKPEIQPPKPRNPGGGGNNNRGGGQGGGAAPAVQIPKPPTAEEWWAKADNRERASWVMALFAETSNLFEVADDQERSPCLLCQGHGIITKVMQTGDPLVFLCNRCGGARHDVTVKFR